MTQIINKLKVWIPIGLGSLERSKFTAFTQISRSITCGFVEKLINNDVREKEREEMELLTIIVNLNYRCEDFRIAR